MIWTEYHKRTSWLDKPAKGKVRPQLRHLYRPISYFFSCVCAADKILQHVEKNSRNIPLARQQHLCNNEHCAVEELEV